MASKERGFVHSWCLAAAEPSGRQFKAASHREAKRLVLLLAESEGHQQRASVQTGLLQNLASQQRKPLSGKRAQIIVQPELDSQNLHGEGGRREGSSGCWIGGVLL